VRVTVAAVGRLGRMPENGLVQDYLGRATQSGRALGLGPFDLAEVEGRRPGKPAEAAALLAALPSDAHRIVLDERGRQLSSRELADQLRRLRDSGVRRTAFLIGGADGHADDIRDGAASLLAFGPQTWPHALVRLMLAEQLYRAVKILAGSPYHRD